MVEIVDSILYYLDAVLKILVLVHFSYLETTYGHCRGVNYLKVLQALRLPMCELLYYAIYTILNKKIRLDEWDILGG